VGSRSFATGFDFGNPPDTLLQHTATLNAGDVVTVEVENVDVDPSQVTVVGYLAVGATDGWFYPFTLQQYGASPGSWLLYTDEGAAQDIFAGVNWNDGEPPVGDGGTLSFFPPYMAADSIDGGDITVWCWRFDGTGQNSLVRVNLTTGAVTQYPFEDVGAPDLNSTPIWVYEGVVPHPGISKFRASDAVQLRFDRT
jgi:hypothetical protein